MKGKISKIEYVKQWGEGAKSIHYHNVWFEGSDDKWNIGTKQESPAWFKVGATIEYEITDEGKKKIKRVQAAMANTAGGGRSYGGGGGGYSKKPAAPVHDPNSPSLIRHLDTFNESDLIFIDIETAGAVKELKPGTPLHDAWLYKTRYNNELERKSGEPVTPEEYFKEKAALYAAFARTVAIVVGRIHGDQLATKKYLPTKETKWSEEPMLREFNADIEKVLERSPSAVLVGWANIGFDQPFLAKRMYVHGIKPNILLDTAHLKPWEVPGFDLKTLWQGTAFYPDSLIAAAVALGIDSPKSNMDGSQVSEAFYSGKIEDIGNYCVGDVLTEANVYRKLAGKSLLTLK